MLIDRISLSSAVKANGTGVAVLSVVMITASLSDPYPSSYFQEQAMFTGRIDRWGWLSVGSERPRTH